MRKRAVLVTSGQPALNPRLVKEADALVSAGYQVTVIYQYWNRWGTAADRLLLASRAWTAVCVGGDPEQERALYLCTRIVYKMGRWCATRFGVSRLTAKWALGRGSWLLSAKAAAIPADLYIGHNLPALPAVVRAARKWGAVCGFDAEDFHRSESSDDPADFRARLARWTEDKYLEQTDYLTTSAPLISREYRRLYPTTDPVTVRNVFPKTAVSREEKPPGPVQLFWFSQTVGPGRGLEEILAVLADFSPGEVCLNILGECSAAPGSQFDELRKALAIAPEQVHFLAPVPPDQLITLAARFDIGIAAETGVPLNRDICLTNKLFTYLQAGLAVVASDTRAQQDFAGQYPGALSLYPRGNARELSRVLRAYLEMPHVLRDRQRENKYLADTVLHWEAEQKIFLAAVDRAMLKHTPETA